MKLAFKIVIIALAVLVGFYPLVLFAMGIPSPLVEQKSIALQRDMLWNILFLIHTLYGGLALLIGWILFIKKIRDNKIKVHRVIGKMYVVLAVMASISGLHIAYYAEGGWVAVLGFMTLALLWLFTTVKAFLNAVNGLIIQHQSMMIFSYALCFSGVTFRIWNPTLTLLLDDSILAYQVASWEAWLPNLFIAFLIVRNKSIKDVKVKTK